MLYILYVHIHSHIYIHVHENNALPHCPSKCELKSQLPNTLAINK